MYAVIKTGGKQYRVSEGDVLRVEKMEAEAGVTVEFDQVLMVGGDDVKLGSPALEGGRVSAEVMSHGRGRKIDIVKFKRRQGYHRKHGHRQHYTEVKVTGIEAG